MWAQPPSAVHSPQYGQRISSQAYEIFPKIAGLFAPVAEGRFDGLRFHVWKASNANAAASFASEGSPNSSDERICRPRGCNWFASIPMSVGLFAPPPETMKSRYVSVRRTTNRRIASVIDLAVNAVAVPTIS